MLNRFWTFPKRSSAYFALHHHEFIDGSGFHDGLQGMIPKFRSRQIVSLANDYDRSSVVNKYHLLKS